MRGTCVIVDSDRRQRDEFQRLARQAGLEVTLAAADDTDPVFREPAALRLAIVAVDPPEDRALTLLSRLCLAVPDCLLLAVDTADTPESAARAFAAGAHDVLRLPLRPPEAAARIARGLARMSPDPLRQAEAMVNAMIRDLDLKQAEARLLRIFAASLGQIVTRDELSQQLHGEPWTYGDRRFDVHVTRIRRKLREAWGDRLELKTIRSVGYALELSD